MIVSPPRETGTFLMHGRGDNLSFRNRVYDDEIWFDAKPIFDRLHKIGASLGYKLGSSVSCDSLNVDTKIVEIVDFAFYEKGHSFPSINDSIYPVFTLLYKLEGDDNLHQVNDIDLLTSKSVDNIVDETIKENFYDLLDDNTIEYFSNMKSYRGSSHYECSLKLRKLLTPDILLKVSEMLSIAEKRLKDQGITLLIKKFNTQDDAFFSAADKPSFLELIFNAFWSNHLAKRSSTCASVKAPFLTPSNKCFFIKIPL